MQKKASLISITIGSVLIALVCLLISLVTPTNSWFSAEQKQMIYFDINISSLNIKVYQDSVVDANEKLILENASVASNYITLPVNTVITPDEYIPLVLIIKNMDSGTLDTEGSYIRCKLELINNVTDEVIPIVTSGETESTATAEGFVKIDGWLYYQMNGSNIMFGAGKQATLLTQFKVEYANFFDENGEMLNMSDSVRFELTVQNSSDGTNYS